MLCLAKVDMSKEGFLGIEEQHLEEINTLRSLAVYEAADF